MRPTLTLLALISLLSLIFYLNQTYANFFNRIGEQNLPSPYLHTEPKLKLGNPTTPPLTLITLGDSLTSGVGSDNYQDTFPYKYAENLAQNSNVTLINKSLPGAKITDLDPFIDSIPELQPDIITVFIGINDLFNRTPLTVFENKYNEILEKLDKTNAKIIIFSIPYLGTKKSVPPPFNILYDYKLTQYNKIINKVAGKHSNNIKVFDLYNATKIKFKDEIHYSSDLFHPNAKGYILWANLLIKSGL